MSRRFKLAFLTIAILLVAIIIMAAAAGWRSSLTQMNMPTETLQPESTVSPVPQMQDTPTPSGGTIEQNVPSPTWTSIFTGFTPYPNSTYSSMGGSGMMGGCSGMGGMGSMGSGSMGMSGTLTPGSGGMGGMGSMGAGGMATGSCPMMSGSAMSGSGMNNPGMYEGYPLGMDMSGMSGYVEDDDSFEFNDPWLLIGWVLFVLLILTIIVAAVVGIAWLIRRLRNTNPT